MAEINRHFKREAKIMLLIFAVFVALSILAAFVTPVIMRRNAEDRCPDKDISLKVGSATGASPREKK